MIGSIPFSFTTKKRDVEPMVDVFEFVGDYLVDQEKGIRHLITWFLNLVMEGGHHQPRRAKGPPRRPVRRRLGGGLWKATSTRKSAGTVMEFALRLVGEFVGVERIEKAEGGDTGGVRGVIKEIKLLEGIRDDN